MAEENYSNSNQFPIPHFILGKPINPNSEISAIEYNSDFGKGLSEEAQRDIEGIIRNYKTSLYLARDFFLD